MELISKRFLGSGANWTVHELKFDSPYYSTNGSFYLTVAQKTSNFGANGVRQNIEAFRRIKKAGLPTLSYFESTKIEEQECIVCENLSDRERLYVSPNTARHFPTENDLLIKSLTSNKTLEQVRSEQALPSVAEDFLRKNKVRKILNFEEFVLLLEKQIDKGTEHGIGFCEDMFFFGTNRTPDTALDYLLADFDNVIDFEWDFSESIILKNRIVALTSVYEFVDQFVENGVNKANYVAFLEDRMKD